MWVRVAGLRIGHFGRLAGSAPSRAALLCLAMSGCMTLGDKTPPSPASGMFPGDSVTQPASLMVPEPAVPLHPLPRKVLRDARQASPEVHAPREKAAEKPAAEKPAPPEKQLAAIDPDRLIGLNPAGVEKLMGTPARMKDDHLSREWVYTSPGCNFHVFFYPNLNAALFRALKYGGSDNNGVALPASNPCVRRMLTARANATD